MEYNIDVIKGQGGIVNDKFGVGEQEWEVELGEGLTIADVDFSELISDAMEEHDLMGYDLGKLSIVGSDDQQVHTLVENVDGYKYLKDENYDIEGEEIFETDLVEIDELEDLDLGDSDNWYFKIFDTKTRGTVFEAKNFDVKFTFVKSDFGGMGQMKTTKYDDFKKKKSVTTIKNKDDLCLGRCLTVAFFKRHGHESLKQITMGRKIQGELTKDLYRDAGVEEGPSSLEKIKQFEKYLDASITIIDSNQFNNVVYPDTKDPDYEVKDFNIYLLKSGKHYDLINCNQIAGFFCKNNYCHKCKKTYHNKDTHICDYKCRICCSKDCDCIDMDFSKVKKWHDCKECYRFFPSQNCFDNHKLCPVIESGKNKGDTKDSICQKRWKCPKCKVMYDSKRFDRNTHLCGDYWCGNCKCVAHKDHKCYMMPKKAKSESDKYITFDFECSQDSKDCKHEVNYGIASYWNDPKEYEFYNIDEFMEWLLVEDHKDYTVIAHNGRGYDFQFIQEYIYQKTTIKPKNVYAGSKIMLLEIPDYKIRCVDSLNFLTMPLASFPKTFGIKELAKGFFPHFFNNKKNFYYVGKVPSLRYFGYNQLGTKKREELIKWWVAKRATNYKWDQFAEMKKYCKSDVDILRRCCKIFQQLYLDTAGIDPFQYTTIASVCMAIFKSECIIEPDIQIGPDEELETPTKEEKELEQLLIRQKVFEDAKIAILPIEQQNFIRKSFFGGRTNATKLLYNFKGTEVGRYIDITSLYPTVNYYDDYPMGHPIEITENFGDVTKYFGFVECYVIPPKDLYFPVLATKGKKLTFDLLEKRGTWTSIELNKAIEMGYVVTEIYKVLHFPKRGNHLFKNYVSKFLKIKQEASGLPSWVKNSKDKQKYIDDYYKNQGIKLDPDKIEFNAGLRAMAKLCLNSLWGKFGQRPNMPKSEIVNDKAKWNKLMFGKKYTGQDFHLIDGDRAEITYKMATGDEEANYNTNIAIAAFTTAHARLRLYVALETLGDQVLYHDTDSVVYKFDPENPNHKEFELGDYLGDWTDELEGWTMKGTFVSGGPKNYSYEKFLDGKVKRETKIKGMTLNYEATRQGKLNHDSMVEMITDICIKKQPAKCIPITYNMIGREKKTKKVNTFSMVKRYGFCYDKRSILEADEDGNIDTLPYGHHKL